MIGPQSKAVIESLLQAKSVSSGSLRIGPLDGKTQILLKILTEKFESLNLRTGADQANALREFYIHIAWRRVGR